MITSTANPRVRFLRSLHERRGRRESGCFLVEGTRLVSDALQAGATFELILYDPTRMMASPVGAALLDQLPAAAALAASERVVAAACDTATPQGIVAAVKQSPPRPIEAGLALIVDGLQDPGNLGTIVRSAAAAGAGAVLTSAGTADVFGPKAVRAGMGAHFRIGLYPDHPWPAIQDLMRDRALLVALPRGGCPFWDVDWTNPSGIIIGGEAAGPSEYARKLATTGVTIPMHRDVESLNAAMAASIIAFESFRQRSLATRP